MALPLFDPSMRSGVPPKAGFDGREAHLRPFAVRRRGGIAAEPRVLAHKAAWRCIPEARALVVPRDAG